jgi:hypothetical protein
MALPFELGRLLEVFSVAGVEIDCAVGVCDCQLRAVVIILIVRLHRRQCTMEADVSMLMVNLGDTLCSVLPRM